MTLKKAILKTIPWGFDPKSKQVVQVSWRTACRFARKERNAACKMSNETLLRAVIDLASGDMYDGGLTVKGRIRYNRLWAELCSRLRICGYLKEEHESI